MKAVWCHLNGELERSVAVGGGEVHRVLGLAQWLMGL